MCELSVTRRSMAWQAPRGADGAMNAQQRRHLHTSSATPLMRWMIEGVIHHTGSAMTSWILRGRRDRAGQISRKSVGPARYALPSQSRTRDTFDCGDTLMKWWCCLKMGSVRERCEACVYAAYLW